MRFLNHITPFDEFNLSIINKVPILHEGKITTLTDILNGDPELAFSFLKQQVCFNKIMEPLKLDPALAATPRYSDSCHIQLYAYSDWMKQSITAIKELDLKRQETWSHEEDETIARLIEITVIKQFIAILLPAENIKLDLKDKARALFNDFADKLYPSIFIHTTWEIILSAFIQSFPTDIQHVSGMLTDLIGKNMPFTFFSEYKRMIDYIEGNTLSQNHLACKPDLIKTFLNETSSPARTDIKTIFTLLCLKNTGQHNLIMYALEGCQSQIPNHSDQLFDHQSWIALVKKIFLAIEHENHFFLIIKSIFEDKQLHPEWFPIVAHYPIQDAAFFYLFLRNKNTTLHQYIAKEHRDFLRNPSFPLVRALKEAYGRSYLEYGAESLVWYAQDTRVNNQVLFETIINENEILPLTPKVAQIIAEILFIRGLQNDDIYLFEYILDLCDISEYSKLASHIPFLLKLPNEIEKLFAQFWINKAKNDPHQIQIMDEFIKKLNKNSQAEQLFEIKKILTEHIESAALRAKKIAAELLETELLELEEKEEKKTKKNNKKAKNKSTKNQAPKKTIPTDPIEMAEKKENPLKSEIKTAVPPELRSKKQTPAKKPLLTSKKNQSKPKIKVKTEPNPVVNVLETKNTQSSLLPEPASLPMIQTALPDRQNTPALVLEPENRMTPEIINAVQKTENQSSIEHCIQNKKNIHFCYNPNVRPWIPPKSEPNLFPPLKMPHPVLAILKFINKIYKTIYVNKGVYPTLTCYGSASERLFDDTFFNKRKKTLNPHFSEIHDIDLYLHLPEGLDDTSIEEWSNTFKNKGAAFLYCLDRRTTDDYVQLRFNLQETQIDLTLSPQKLKPIFELPTIVLKPDQPFIGHFCIPRFFYDNQNTLNKMIRFNPDLHCEDLLNPKTLSFVWKKWAYLRAAYYQYNKSVVYMMKDLEAMLFNRPEIIQESLGIFFNEYFPKNPDFFFNQFQQDALKITSLDPYLLSATLQGYVYGPRFKAY